MEKLAISANRPLPGATFNATSKETRGWLWVKPTIECACSGDKGKVKSYKWQVLSSNPGYTPVRATREGPVLKYLDGEGDKPVVTASVTGKACITIKVFHKSRVGTTGTRIGTLLTTLGPPFIWRSIDYTMCHDGRFTLKWGGSDFPSHAVYLEGIAVGVHNQEGLFDFLLSGGGATAPGGSFSEVSGTLP